MLVQNLKWRTIYIHQIPMEIQKAYDDKDWWVDHILQHEDGRVCIFFDEDKHDISFDLWQDLYPRWTKIHSQKAA